MFANSDDEMLVHHCLAGDENAFGFLVHKYKDLIHAYAYQRVLNYADAEDITQEVFIRAYRNLAKLKYPHKFRSWLYAIASNECNRWLSRNLRRWEKEVNLEDAPEDAFGFEADFARMPANWQIDLEEALENLPDDNRIVVSMFYMSDCSLKEISEHLGVSINTVKGKLHRARQQLGNAMSETYGRALSKKKLKGGFIMRIVGTVTDKLTRQLVASAPVSITGIGNDKTDSKGQFSIDNLPEGKGGILWVDMKGYGKKMVRFKTSEAGSDMQVDVQLGPSATVVGRIVDSDGRPIAGASVEIISDYYPIRSVKTDAKGKYQLEDIEVRQDAYHLFVGHPDFIYSPPSISVNKTGIVEVPDVVLTRGVTLKGRVTDEFGKPIQGAKVRAGGPDVETNANGEYHLKNVPGNFATV